ncbi:hypothetical protein CERZMDRAFT_103223 [Cercospora zeae-maydis SCOH1-5]|uniref:Uncharacterized protein n=1 Tax=Cercospora zeae-maydis SCOH1-5 TaxID=717836 RepID=A0A6A6F2M1_9PEZI|nr:hypothetical protein CERZMDRAFT_103223 [Cercospora zeae-maydis SCOH1-5]
MHFTTSLAACVLVSFVLAAPIPQLAGEGAACNSVFSSTDNGVGYGTENALDKLAGTISGAKGSRRRRQLAGEGAACNSLFSSTDNGVGFGVENFEDGLAGDDNQASGGSSGGAPPPPPPPPGPGPHRRQLDKIAKGVQTLSSAIGTGPATSSTTGALADLDGEATGAAANVGAELGGSEEQTLEEVGSTLGKAGGSLLSGAGNTGSSSPSLPSLVPHLPALPAVPARRQLDKIAKGAQTLAASKGLGSVTEAATNEAVDLDGELTGDAANAGQQVGSTEESTLEQVGNSA